jgi:UDP-N-acetylglucosamine 2-epimerase (non-hydrolysing)
MHILHVVGARPNFMKAAPVLRALRLYPNVRQTLVHTGQHYDAAMSDVFFRQLEMPEPDFNLGVGSGSHAQQTAAIMQGFEPVVLKSKADLVLVYGDVNSTVAAALTCSKIGVPLGHVEAGLRSRDRSMPEEINRLVTDQLSDLLFTPSPDADENLLREGISAERIHQVGNVMIDTLVRLLPCAEDHFPGNLSRPYALVTLHRPSNVDDVDWLRDLLTTLTELSSRLTVIFPVHPRTRRRLETLTLIGETTVSSPTPAPPHTDASSVLGTLSEVKASRLGTNPAAWPDQTAQLHLLGPLPYLEFLGLESKAMMVITDSGGIQEETTFLGVPCLTVRENTERPVTVTQGTNQLVGRDLKKLRRAAEEILKRSSTDERTQRSRRLTLPLWDGHAAERIAPIIVRRSAQ